MKTSTASGLRVIVKTVSQSRNPDSWVIIDDDKDGRQVKDSPDLFRTSSLAWEAGVSALARMAGPSPSAR